MRPQKCVYIDGVLLGSPKPHIRMQDEIALGNMVSSRQLTWKVLATFEFLQSSVRFVPNPLEYCR